MPFLLIGAKAIYFSESLYYNNRNRKRKRRIGYAQDCVYGCGKYDFCPECTG